MEQDTSGFYKHIGGDDVIHAPNFVYAPSFTLLKEEHDSYSYPVDGWIWFDSVEEAYSTFNLPLPENV